MQGFECRVLSPYLAQPLRDVFLPYIFLEWMHVRHVCYICLLGVLSETFWQDHSDQKHSDPEIFWILPYLGLGQV